MSNPRIKTLLMKLKRCFGLLAVAGVGVLLFPSASETILWFAAGLCVCEIVGWVFTECELRLDGPPEEEPAPTPVAEFPARWLARDIRFVVLCVAALPPLLIVLGALVEAFGLLPVMAGTGAAVAAGVILYIVRYLNFREDPRSRISREIAEDESSE